MVILKNTSENRNTHMINFLQFCEDLPSCIHVDKLLDRNGHNGEEALTQRRIHVAPALSIPQIRYEVSTIEAWQLSYFLLLFQGYHH
jgi:hypothetical protein